MYPGADNWVAVNGGTWINLGDLSTDPGDDWQDSMVFPPSKYVCYGFDNKYYFQKPGSSYTWTQADAFIKDKRGTMLRAKELSSLIKSRGHEYPNENIWIAALGSEDQPGGIK